MAPSPASKDEDASVGIVLRRPHRRIARGDGARKREEPNWQPSHDLARKFARKEMRVRIMAFWKERQCQELVDYVKA